jgi:hypothetical protein
MTEPIFAEDEKKKRRGRRTTLLVPTSDGMDAEAKRDSSLRSE